MGVCINGVCISHLAIISCMNLGKFQFTFQFQVSVPHLSSGGNLIYAAWNGIQGSVPDDSKGSKWYDHLPSGVDTHIRIFPISWFGGPGDQWFLMVPSFGILELP